MKSRALTRYDENNNADGYSFIRKIPTILLIIISGDHSFMIRIIHQISDRMKSWDEMVNGLKYLSKCEVKLLEKCSIQLCILHVIQLCVHFVVYMFGDKWLACSVYVLQCPKIHNDDDGNEEQNGRAYSS